MALSERLALLVTADVNDAVKGFQKVGKAADKELTGAEKKARKFGSGLSVVGSSLAALGAGVFLKGAFSEFEEAERSAKQLEQTIRSTGGAAGVTADQASALADSISKVSVVDDEVVAGAERMLLTFKEIKNTDVDKTFDRATQASIDLAAGMGIDAQAAALQLGKALNSPAEGIAKLQRAGISFNQDQKELIKTLAATGRTAEAQGIILAEVESQFGGQAEAAATSADRARVAFGNLQESVGSALAPAFEKAAKTATSLFDAFSSQPQALQQVELGAAAAAIAYAQFGDSAIGAAKGLNRFLNESSGAKAALGKAGIAGAATLAAVALAHMGREARIKGLRNISSDVDEVSGALRELAATGEGDILGDISDSFGGLDDQLRKLFDNPIFETSIVGSLFGGDVSAAEQDIDTVDKALTNLVETGERAAASGAFRKVREELLAQGYSADEINDKFNDYNGAVEDAGRSSLIAATGLDEFGNEVADTAPKVQTLAERLQAYNDEIDRYLDHELGQAEATDRIAQGFLDLGEAIKEVKKPEGLQTADDFNANTEAAINYRDQIRDLVGFHADLIKTTAANRDEQELLAQSFYDQAVAMGLPKEEALKYTAILLGIPPDAETEIRQEGMAKAKTDTVFLRNKLGEIPGTYNAKVDVDTSAADAALNRIGSRLAAFGNARVSAAFVQANMRAEGGPVKRGQPYIVGEKRPELFVPDQNGTILPSVPRVGGRSVQINNTFHITESASAQLTAEAVVSMIARSERALAGSVVAAE